LTAIKSYLGGARGGGGPPKKGKKNLNFKGFFKKNGKSTRIRRNYDKTSFFVAIRDENRQNNPAPIGVFG